MRQVGFISPTLIIGGVMLAAIAVMGIGLKIQTARLDNAKAETEQVKAQFAGFKAEVKRMGDEAQAKADAERKRQEKVNRETVKSYETRLASITDTYRRLRDQRSDPGASPVPAVPATARATDDAARNKQLLDVLQHADLQTARLIELQQWVSSQANR